MVPDSQPEHPAHEPAGARLETWKQIAGFFDREVRTVQRWEKTLGLPVHRYRNAKQDSVYAFEHELKTWREARRQLTRSESANGRPAAESDSQPVSAAQAMAEAVRGRAGLSRNRRILLVLACAATVLIGTAVVRTLGERRQKLPNDLASTTFAALAGQQFSPTFSPDGRQIAFTWNGLEQDVYNIYVKGVGAFSERRLTTDDAIDYSPAWSPDGKLIAFCRGTRVHQAALFVLSASGSRREEKILDLDSAADPAGRVISWSADSKTVVLSDTQDGVRHSLYLVDIASHQTTQITFPGRTQSDFNPSFSPNGSRIAFVRQNGEGRYELHVLTIAAHSVRSAKILQLPGFERDAFGQPVWTPDSAHIVFVANHNGETGLWLVTPEFEGAPHFVAVGRDVIQPAISKLGQLAYIHRPRGVGLWKMSLEADATPVLVMGSQRTQDSPELSPQGDKLAFSSNREGNMNVWVSNTNGSSPAPVTFFKGPLAGSPSWSPNGSQLVFDVREEGGTAVYTIASNGGVPRKVSHGKNFDGVPFWASDPKGIYFSSDRTGRVEIWKMHPDGTEPEQITKLGGFAGKLSLDGKRLYYMRARKGYSALWQLDLQTGKERCVNPAVFDRAYAPTNFGVIFVPMESKNVYPVCRFDYRSGAVTLLHSLAARPYLGISISPDQKTFFYAREDANPAQIFLIQNFWK